jgi:pilus assembly protein CpaF
MNTGVGFACTVHANSGPDAIEALVNAANMAGEHVPEPFVRKVFASSIDLVVHVDLHDRGDAGARREVREIVAVMPTVGEVVATEPIFQRSHPGAPLEWTGVVPPALDRFTRHLPAGTSLRDLLAGREGATADQTGPAAAFTVLSGGLADGKADVVGRGRTGAAAAAESGR